MKKLFMLISALSIISTSAIISHSQEYWVKTYGGSEYEGAFSGQQTTDGGYIAAGYTSSFGFASGASWVLKLDSNGTVTWQKAYEGDAVYVIQQTTDGGYIVAGEEWLVDRYNDFKVLKLDSTGTISWQKSYGSSNLEQPSSILQTTDGGYIVAGLTAIDVDSDLCLLKLDSAGTISWQKTYGGSSIDFFDHSPIQQTSDGGYIVAGDTGSFGAGSYDFWVLKLDSSGNVTWQKTYGGTESDHASSIQQTTDGGYIVAGRTSSFGAGSNDIWVLKLNSNGNVSWQKTYGGSEAEFSAYIKQTTDEGYLMAIITDSFGAGYFDIWVVKLDNNGNVSWEKTYGGSGDDQPRSIQQTSEGGYIVSGYTDSFGAGGRDLWVLKLDTNGEIPGCDIMNTSNATVTDTSVAGVNTSITAQPFSAVITDTSVTPQDTSAMLDTLCSADEVTLTVGNGSGFPGSSNNPVIVTLDTNVKLRGIQWDICNVDDSLTPNGCETTERTNLHQCAFLEHSNGCDRFVLLSYVEPAIQEGDGPIAILKYDVSPGAPSGSCQDLTLGYVSLVRCIDDGTGGCLTGPETSATSEGGQFCIASDSASIPTLGEWGMIILMTIIMGSAVISLRKRRMM